jgi:hypothetical protein
VGGPCEKGEVAPARVAEIERAPPLPDKPSIAVARMNPVYPLVLCGEHAAL